MITLDQALAHLRAQRQPLGHLSPFVRLGRAELAGQPIPAVISRQRAAEAVASELAR